MKLKASYATKSDVPAGFEGAYTEQDGKFVLSGGDFEFKTEADVTAMKTAKDRANTELSESKAKLKEFDGLDPKAHKALQEENDVLRAKAKDGGSDEETIKAIVDARVARATEELTKTNGDLTSQLDELNGFKLKTEKTGILGELLAKNVSESARGDAEFILGSVLERQADGTFMSNGNANFEKGLSPEQVVEKALESRPHWKKTNTPGHGAGGSSAVGDTSKQSRFNALMEKENKSRSEDMELYALASEMKAEQTTGE